MFWRSWQYPFRIFSNWTFSHDMWKARCSAIHTNQIQSSMSHNTYAVQLQALLRYPPPASMPAHDRKHFIPLEQALTYNYQRQKRLLRLLTTFTNAHAHRINTPSARLMTKWLHSFHDHWITLEWSLRLRRRHPCVHLSSAPAVTGEAR